MFIVKRLFSLFLCIGVFLCAALLLSACSDEAPPKREGVLYGATFDSGVDGLEIPTQAIESGGKIREPQMDLREGYVFVGWKDGDRFWNFEIDLVDKNVELVAVWEVDELSWKYSDGLEFSFDEENDAYFVSGYTGSEAAVEVPLYYSGDEGIRKVKYVGDAAFKDNGVITSISLPTSVTEIKASSFENSVIERFEISVNLSIIGEAAFKSCENLTTITYENQASPIYFGDYAFSGSGVRQLMLADNVREIGSHCFYNSSLSEIIMGSKSTLTSIGESAFEGTNLSFFKTPSGVTRVGSRAFKDCESLEKIVFPSLKTNVGVEMFVGDTSLEGVYYTGELLVHESQDWKGVEVLEFAYSASDIGMAGRWDYGPDGRPERHKASRETVFDFTSLSEVLSDGDEYTDFVVAAYHYYPLGGGRVLCDIITESIDENGFVEILLDEYCDSLYNVYVFKKGNNYENPTSSLLFIENVDMAFDRVVFVDPSITACFARPTYPQGD